MLEKLKAAADYLRNAEPAAAIGVVITVLAEVQQVVVENDATNWKVALPAIVAFVVRQLVVSPRTSQAREQEAFVRGILY